MFKDLEYLSNKGKIEIDTVYNADCIEGMRYIPDNSIDCIICDLPYGSTSCTWDTIIPFEQLWEQYNRIAKTNAAIVLFGNEPFASYLRLSNIKNYRYDIYWQKERITNIMQVKKRVGKDVETISVFYREQCTYNPQMVEYNGAKRTNKVKDGKVGKLSDSKLHKVNEYEDKGVRYPTQIWKYKRDILTSNLHPTQKPLELIRALVRTFSNPNDIILDNTIGSGTTAVAALMENRHYIGFENDRKYYNIAIERIKNANC